MTDLSPGEKKSDTIIAVADHRMAKVVKCPDGHETTVYVDPDATITLNRVTCAVCGKPIKMLGHRVTGS